MAKLQTEQPSISLEAALAAANDAAASPPPAEQTIDEDTLSSLNNMTKEALILLIRRVGGAMWGVGIMTTEQRREAMKLKIAGIALTARDNQTVLKAYN